MIQDGALIVEQEVRERVKVQGIDPSSAGAIEVARLVDAVLEEYDAGLSGNGFPPIKDRDGVRRTVVDRIAGLGPLQPLMDDPDVEEIWINDPGKVFVARDGRHQLTNILLDHDEVVRLVERMLRASNRRVDLSSPFVDAVLQDGSRLHVVIPDVARRHWAVNIRKFVLRAHRLDELVRLGSLSPGAARFLDAAVKSGLNIVVSGGTQTGKTTMLNCLAGAVPARDRVITCEEVFELQVSLPDVVAMQTRQVNLEGRGAIDLRRLISEALRMRPNRIIVGEVRQQEALDLLVALNSGFPGMTSVHANSATEALTKLATLPLLAGENVTRPFILPTVAQCVDLVVHLVLQGDRRRTHEIVGVTGRLEGEQMETIRLFERHAEELTWTGHQPPRVDRFAAAGIELREILR